MLPPGANGLMRRTGLVANDGDCAKPGGVAMASIVAARNARLTRRCEFGMAVVLLWMRRVLIDQGGSESGVRLYPL